MPRASFGSLSAVIAGFVLAVMTGAGIPVLFEQRWVDRFDGVETLVLGTSLVHYAIPDPKGGPLLTNGGERTVMRVGIGGGSERDLLDIAQIAAKQSMEDILIEANPIVSRFANSRAQCRGPLCVVDFVRRQRSNLSEALNRSRRGLEPVTRYPEATEIPANLDRLLPLTIVDPAYEAAWTAMIAEHPQTRFTFLVMPRSKIAHETIGEEEMAAFRAAAEALAQRTGAGILVVDPERDWADAYFADQAHMSALGGIRFQQLLVDWLEARR